MSMQELKSSPCGVYPSGEAGGQLGVVRATDSWVWLPEAPCSLLLGPSMRIHAAWLVTVLRDVSDRNVSAGGKKTITRLLFFCPFPGARLSYSIQLSFFYFCFFPHLSFSFIAS